jgi:hypothetical protein
VLARLAVLILVYAWFISMSNADQVWHDVFNAGAAIAATFLLLHWLRGRRV